MKSRSISYQEALRYLYSLQKYGIKFGLSKTSNLLKAFGNPHVGKNYIHVAGTNGKGSVAAMLSSILKEAGFKVGFYSSPHLVRFTERFKINDREMAAECAAGLTQQLMEAAIPEEPPTFFEATTAMALVYFAREKVDISVMEVGMGGRLDATNVITPLISVITNISLEHQAFLGKRLLEIAREKAGIIKEGIEVITAATQPRVVGLLEEICREKNAALWRVGKEIRFRTSCSGLHYYGPNRIHHRLQLGLKGRFQARNTAVVLAVLDRLDEKGFPVSLREIQEGLQHTQWPGRMQVISREPLVLIDGGHNPAAMRALSRSIRSAFEYERLFLVIGVMEDKDIPGILQEIVPLADHVIFTRPEYYRAAAPQTLLTAGREFAKSTEVVPVLTDAIEKAKNLAGSRDMIVVTGSLFTVGEALSYFDPETYRPDDL